MNTSEVLKRIKFNDMERLGKSRHLNRILKMLNALKNRWPGLKFFNQIRFKHVSWLNLHWLPQQNYQPATMKDYQASLKLIIETFPHSKDWLARLKLQPKGPGGRPRKAKIVKNKKITEARN